LSSVVSPPAPQPGRRPPIAFVAVAVVLLLIAASVVVVVRGDEDEEPDRAGSVTTVTAPGTSELDGLVRELQGFVEDARGLRFKREVDVRLLESAAFRQRVLDDVAEDAEELEDAEDVLIALGLLDADVDLEVAVNDLIGGGVAGFYDPETDELVVRGAEPTPFVRQVLIHELTHALQDQHFELHRPALEDRDDEASLAFTGLVEGDATVVEQRFVASLPADERRAAQAEEARQAGALDPDIPGVLYEIFGFPYIVGPQFVQRILRAGGPARLNAAFTSPPTTTEHLLHPNRFLAGEAPRPVTAPKADGEIIDEGVIGEMGFELIFGVVFDAETARSAAAGWGGDRYVAWRQGSRTCVRTSVVMDTAGATARLARALDEWVNERQRARVDGTDPVTFTSCG
jgi:hypothetical protein